MANWIAGATQNKGALHRALGVPEGQKIPAAKMAAARNSSDPTTRKQAALAGTLGKLRPKKSSARASAARARAKGY